MTQGCSSIFFRETLKILHLPKTTTSCLERSTKNVLVDFEGHKLIRDQNKDTTSNGLDPYPPYARATSAPWQGPDKCALHFFLPWGNLQKWRTLAAINFLRWDSCGFCWQMEFMDSHKNFIGNQIYSNDTGFRTCPEMDHFCTRCLHAQQHSFLGVVDGWLTSLRQQRWNQRDG